MRIRKQGPIDVIFSNEDIIAAAKISDALAHPARIRILRYILSENLARRNVTNKDLVIVFDYAQATISQHLSKLLIGGLVDVRKKGTSSYYFAHVGRLSTYTEILKKIESRGDEEEMPGFLRAELFETENDVLELSGELDQEFFEDSMGDDFDDAPHFL
jgi:DNA-binding transcriptional ArsR family regulator